MEGPGPRSGGTSAPQASTGVVSPQTPHPVAQPFPPWLQEVITHCSRSGPGLQDETPTGQPNTHQEGRASMEEEAQPCLVPPGPGAPSWAVPFCTMRGAGMGRGLKTETGAPVPQDLPTPCKPSLQTPHVSQPGVGGWCQEGAWHPARSASTNLAPWGLWAVKWAPHGPSVT